MLKFNFKGKIKVLVLALVIILVTSGVVVAENNKYAMGRESMVAAAHPLATEAGFEILEKGGNAIDAAVAVGFALSVVEPFASGLGGEGVMMVYLAEEDEVIAIDYKGEAPSLVPEPEDYDKETVTDEEHWRMGVGAQYVPGTPAGLAFALENYGTMELAEVLEPAIRYAEEGFEVYPLLAELIADRQQYMNDAAKELFLPNDQVPLPGDTFYQKDQAETLSRIAEEGIEVFYEGEIGDKIAEALEGHFLKEDLVNYEPIVKEPATGNYRGYDIYSSPPPVSGAVLIKALNILEIYDVNKFYDTDEALYNHLLMEAFDIAVADYYQAIIDPAYGNPPIDKITDEVYAMHRALLIGQKDYDGYYSSGLDLDPEEIIDWDVISEKRAKSVQPAVELAKDDIYLSESTTQFVAADKEGNIVSATNTLSYFMGSRFVIPETGILMNNGLGLFSNDPNDVARLDPGKRPRSMLSPTIVTKDGEPFMAVGTPGATRIMTTVGQVIVNVIDHDMRLLDAIEEPRMHWGGALEGPSDELVERLEEMGHDITARSYPDNYFGGVQAILFDPGVLIYGAADLRRAGTAKGK